MVERIDNLDELKNCFQEYSQIQPQIYLGRAFSSVVPFTLLFLNAQDKFDLSYQLALTLLISQISFGLLNFWMVNRRFKNTKILTSEN